MCVVTESGFGTVSSAVLALPQPGPNAPIWRFAAGPPDRSPFAPIVL
jgi:hypothetical protein